MKSIRLHPVLVVFALSLMSGLLLSGCSEKGNEPVKDGKTVTSDRETMQKMYQGGGGGAAPAQPAPAK